MHKYFLDEKMDPEDYEFASKKLGKDTLIIYTYLKHMSPAIPTRYICFKNGQIQPLNLETLTQAYRDELINIVPSMKKAEIIIKFVEHHTDEDIKHIKSIADIPEYKRKPIDPDLENTVRDIYKTAESVYIAYFYQHIGGIVYRYRFQFDNDDNIKRISQIVIGEAVGNPIYYE